MSEKLLKYAHTHFARQFVESTNEASNNMYYVFVTTHTDRAEGVAPVESFSQVINAYNDMIFGKLVSPSDVTHSIKNYSWSNGTVYTAYDDQDSTLIDSQYYVVVNEGSDYHVWKCIDNNSNSASVTVPSYATHSVSGIHEILEHPATDGYKWKYMYGIDSATYSKFSSNNYVPVVSNTEISANAIRGTIDRVVVTNAGNNYNEFANGTVSPLSGITNTSVLRLEGDNLSGNNNFYKNCAIYITTGAGAGELKKIESYTSNSSGKFVTIYTSSPYYSAFSSAPDSTSVFEITPWLHICATCGTGALARPLVDTSSNTIANVQIINRGSGYSYANIHIEANNTAESNTALFRPVYAPTGGHGSDPINELNARYVTISTSFANLENDGIADNITTFNNFKTVGLLKDPLYANVQLTIDSPSSNFQLNETVYHSSTNAGGIVSFANSTVLRLSNAYGTWGNSANVTGQTSGASALITLYLTNAQDTRSNTHYFQQTTKYYHTLTSGFPFQENERITTEEVDDHSWRGYVYSSNSTITALTGNERAFTIPDGGITVTGDTTLYSATFTDMIGADLVRESGDILYLKNIDAVNRSNTNTETVKFTIEF